MTEESSEKKQVKRKRGKGFPIISLEEAVKITESVKTAGFEINKETLAQEMELSSKGSRFLLKLAALRDFGLFGKKGEKVVFTQLAKNIVAPTSEDKKTREELLKKAFLNSGVFSDVYKRLEDSGGSKKETIGNIAINELGVSIKSRRQFIKSFVDSAKFAYLATEGEDGTIRPTVKKEEISKEARIAPLEGAEIPAGQYKKTVEEVGEGWSLSLKITSDVPIGKQVRDIISSLIEEFYKIKKSSNEETTK